MKPIDNLFNDPELQVTPFEFTAQVAEVFDDMVNRSVPYYQEVQRQTIFLLLSLLQDHDRIYDLGCATGNTIVLLARGLQDTALKDVEIIGYDAAPAMCEQARKKIRRYRIDNRLIRIEPCDILQADLARAGAVVMNYTLQFIPPGQRAELVGRICAGLRRGGVLIVSDKTAQLGAGMSELFIHQYHAYKKKNGYSDLEIARKREALEKVLIPYNVPEAISLFKNAGFASADLFFSWYNFSSFVCVK